ncbi:MAG TPA: hypothetical protein VMZ24_02780 [Patescibacteria group bacterium]|nr:hypothetical protein [Patescibacteria group bacterium]
MGLEMGSVRYGPALELLWQQRALSGKLDRLCRTVIIARGVRHQLRIGHG